LPCAWVVVAPNSRVAAGRRIGLTA
jgi:hypothetical protein